MEKNINISSNKDENYDEIKDKVMTSDFSISDLVDMAENDVDEEQ